MAIHESEIDFQTEIQPCHRFEVSFQIVLLQSPRQFTEKKEKHLQTILEPSSYTPEKFDLFKKYQEDIHHDLRNSPSGFRKFLVDSPLIVII